MQLPDEIQNEAQLLSYFPAWKPPYKTGSVRTYANPSIGTLGLIAAKSIYKELNTAMSHEIIGPLGLKSTYLSVPSEKMASYAFGYTKDKKPVRVNPGMLSSEAYGVKTTAPDLTRFLKANMGILRLESKLQAAHENSRKGYFQVGEMRQDLIWEEYSLPVNLQVLQKGNSGALTYNPTPVIALAPPASQRPNAWVNKTGSTNGFGAYAAFVPSERFGIVVLANKNYPNEERVEIAHKIFEALSGEEASIYALTRVILRKRLQAEEGGSLGPVPADRDIHQAGILRPLGQRRGRLGLWLPLMRQEVSDGDGFCAWAGAAAHFETSVGVKSVESGVLNQAHDRGRTLACPQGACEQLVLSPDRDGHDLVFRPVVIDRQLAIIQEACERTPALEAVVQRSGRGRAVRDLPALQFHPLMKCVGQGSVS